MRYTLILVFCDISAVAWMPKRALKMAVLKKMVSSIVLCSTGCSGFPGRTPTVDRRPSQRSGGRAGIFCGLPSPIRLSNVGWLGILSCWSTTYESIRWRRHNRSYRRTMILVAWRVSRRQRARWRGIMPLWWRIGEMVWWLRLRWWIVRLGIVGSRRYAPANGSV